jgi:pimeloyl-ACP methyl ester carboxylesterase
VAEVQVSSDQRPVSSGTTEINGHRLYWEWHGEEDSPALVLLHHGLGSTRAWKRQIPAFTQSGFGVLAFDRWGYGRSERRDSFEPRFLHHDTAETLALLDQLDVSRASFIGHSDGGSICILLAGQEPDRVERMVLVAAHIYVEPKMAGGLEMIRDAARVPPLRNALEREHGERSQDLVRTWLECWSSHGTLTLNLEDELKKVRCPTLVIQGVEDEHATPQHARDIASGIPDAHLWLIPKVRHMPIHEVPQAFNRIVLAFLTQDEETPDSFEIPQSGGVHV